MTSINNVVTAYTHRQWTQGTTPARLAVLLGESATPAVTLAGEHNYPISGDALLKATPPYTPSRGTLWGAPGISGYGFPCGLCESGEPSIHNHGNA